MRHALVIMEVDDDDTRVFVTLRHAPGCDHNHDHTDRVFTVPPQAAVAIMEGTARVLSLAGQPVVADAPAIEPKIPRPAELDDPDRKRDERG